MFRHHILPYNAPIQDTHVSSSSDDEDFDLMWSDEDDVKPEL